MVLELTSGLFVMLQHVSYFSWGRGRSWCRLTWTHIKVAWSSTRISLWISEQNQMVLHLPMSSDILVETALLTSGYEIRANPLTTHPRSRITSMPIFSVEIQFSINIMIKFNLCISNYKSELCCESYLNCKKEFSLSLYDFYILF